jgi:hypothetical protein
MRGWREFLTGVFIGLVISLLLFARVAFAEGVSPEDAELIAKTVQAESGNQDFQGKRLVAAVVLNRTEHPAFPDGVEEVLSQKNQFATYSNLDRTETTWTDELAVKMEIENRSNTEVLFFRTGRYGTGEPVLKHQDHYFSTIKEEP